MLTERFFEIAPPAKPIFLPFQGVKWGGFVIGITQMIFGLIPLFNVTRAANFSTALADTGYQNEWLFAMFLLGGYLSVTSFCVSRKQRQIALYLSFSVLMSTFFYAVMLHLVSPGVLIMGAHGTLCLVLIATQSIDRRAYGKGR